MSRRRRVAAASASACGAHDTEPKSAEVLKCRQDDSPTRIDSTVSAAARSFSSKNSVLFRAISPPSEFLVQIIEHCEPRSYERTACARLLTTARRASVRVLLQSTVCSGAERLRPAPRPHPTRVPFVRRRDSTPFAFNQSTALQRNIRHSTPKMAIASVLCALLLLAISGDHLLVVNGKWGSGGDDV